MNFGYNTASCDVGMRTIELATPENIWVDVGILFLGGLEPEIGWR